MAVSGYFSILNSQFSISLVSEDVFEFQLLHLAELGEGVEVHVGFFTKAHVDFLLSFDVLVVEVDDVLHGHLGVGLEEYLGAALLQGDVGVESSLGEGSTFWLELPTSL